MKKKVLAVVSVSLSLMLAAVLVSTAMAARDAPSFSQAIPSEKGHQGTLSGIRTSSDVRLR